MSEWNRWREDRWEAGRYDEDARSRYDEPRTFGRREPWESRGRPAAPMSDRGYRFGRRDNQRFHNEDEDRRVPLNETERLIASDKVEGTRVYDRYGERLGAIQNFMVDKRSGTVEYAVLTFGGTLGVGDRHYPLPWRMLSYDERLGGYVVEITQRDLDRAPSHREGEEPRYDRGYGADIKGYYGGS